MPWRYDPLDQTSFDIDRLLASAAKFLIEGGEQDIASLLLSCDLDIVTGDMFWEFGREMWPAYILLRGPRAAFDAFSEWDYGSPKSKLWTALGAALPSNMQLKELDVRAEVVQLDPDWRIELQEIARGRSIHNQAVTNPETIKLWKNLRFRSSSEVKIAEALDRAGVLFIPNCWARLSGDGRESRVNVEPDFLVCRYGKWGILEVDGEPFHPASRAAKEHARDRLFKAHGIRVVERFDATDCWATPDKVVTDFLRTLDGS